MEERVPRVAYVHPVNWQERVNKLTLNVMSCKRPVPHLILNLPLTTKSKTKESKDIRSRSRIGMFLPGLEYSKNIPPNTSLGYPFGARLLRKSWEEVRGTELDVGFLGLRVFRFRVQGLGFQVLSPRFNVQNSEFWG